MAQILNNLPLGAKIKYGSHSVNGEAAQQIIWMVVSKNTGATTSGKPQNSIALLTEKCIDFRCFDAIEPNNPVFAPLTSEPRGFSKYSVSNIRQWMNSSANAGGWYSAQHTYDSPPSRVTLTTGEVIDATKYNTQYLNRPGFLYHFSEEERSTIVNTTIDESFKSGGTTETTALNNQKIFLPSSDELLTGWEYFAKGGSLAGYPTSQAVANSTINTPTTVNNTQNWWTRTQSWDSPYLVHFVSGSTLHNTSGADVYYGHYGFRPAMNLPTTLRISDTTDSDGCYTVVWNTAPSAPTILNVPTIYGGKSNPISWSNVNDPDGDTVTYTLECSSNNGAYSVLYSGTSTAYAHLVPFGTTSVQYRVKATDTSNESSTYTTSTSRSVINNNAPVIDGVDANLGVKSEGFTGTYKVTDANNNSVTVTESIDGVQIRSLVVTLGEENTYGITGNTWLALPNGSHTLTIRATDGIDSSVRTYTFTKLVDSFSIRNSNPWASATMPSRIMLVVTRNLPSGATFKVEVCNNGYDTSPAWEDATDAVRSGLVHVFTNTVKSSGQWGVVVKVTVNRNGATGACYVSAIGGNFE